MNTVKQEQVTPETIARMLEAYALAQSQRDADDAPMLRRTYAVTVRGVDPETRSVEVVASSEAVDSYDEIVEQDWRLERYRANPVVLWNHNRTPFFGSVDPEQLLPIGYASDVRMEGKQLVARLNFVDSKASPMAERVWQGFVQKSLRAVSVGFRSRTVVEERVNDVSVWRLRDNELFEISATPIGANPEAVAKSHEADHRLLREWASRSARAKSNPAAASGGAEPNARVAQETETMKTIEELKAEHEKAMAAAKADADKALADAGARADQAEKALAEARERADKALADLAAAGTALDAEKAAHAATEKARAEAADKVLVHEVDAHVGKKFLPVQRESMLRLARKDRGSFDDLMKDAPDLQMLGSSVLDGAQKVVATKANVPQAVDDADGADFADHVEKMANGAAAHADDGPLA